MIIEKQILQRLFVTTIVSQRSQHAQIASTCDIPEASVTISAMSLLSFRITKIHYKRHLPLLRLHPSLP